MKKKMPTITAPSTRTKSSPAGAEPQAQPKWRKLLVLTIFITYFLTCVFYGLVLILIQLIRNGTNFFKVRPRPTPPPCLTDPAYGEHSYMTLRDIKIHYVKKGDSNRPLILFLHGFPEFWYSWRHQIKEFSKDFCVVAVDMRGYGDSDKPTAKSDYALNNLVSDVAEIINGLGKSQCHLVAHDWGGVIAWSFAMKYPHMLKTLTILNSPHPTAYTRLIRSPSIRQLYKSWYMHFNQLPYLPELLMRGNDLDFLEKVLVKGGRGREMMCSHEIEAYKYTFSKPGAFTGPINYYRNLHFLQRVNSPPQKRDDNRSKISVSTLIIWGTDDVALCSDLAQLSSECVDKCQVRMIPGGSHWIQQDQPQLVNKHIRDFLTAFYRSRGDDVDSVGLIESVRSFGSSLFGSVSDVFKINGTSPTSYLIPSPSTVLSAGKGTYRLTRQLASLTLTQVTNN